MSSSHQVPESDHDSLKVLTKLCWVSPGPSSPKSPVLCRFCRETITDDEHEAVHVAHHMEQIALQNLPSVYASNAFLIDSSITADKRPASIPASYHSTTQATAASSVGSKSETSMDSVGMLHSGSNKLLEAAKIPFKAAYMAFNTAVNLVFDPMVEIMMGLPAPAPSVYPGTQHTAASNSHAGFFSSYSGEVRRGGFAFEDSRMAPDTDEDFAISPVDCRM